MKDIEDFWADDDFEDTVASALIACFESKVTKNRGAAPSDRMKEDRLAVLRAEGPYIASNSRFFVTHEDDTYWSFDLVNDKLPTKGFYAFRPSGLGKENNPETYLIVLHIKQAASLGKHWVSQKHGTLYEMMYIFADNGGIQGERKYFTVTSKGDVVPCFQQIPAQNGCMRKVALIKTPEHEVLETSHWGSVALQGLADRRFCWTITAQEKIAKAHLGCMLEEVKSLLYARSLPMTSTGRKRPILHLVESHKRRIQSGTDIDVTQFLRGVQTVEIGGTVFTVNPPATLRAAVSNPSRARYFAPVAA